MKFLRGGLIAGLTLASLAISSPHVLAATVSAGAADGPVQLVTELTFNSTTPLGLNVPAGTIQSAASGTSGWTIGAQHGGLIGVQPDSTLGSTGKAVDVLEGFYPDAANTSGSNFVWANYNIAKLDTRDIYVEFWARMPGNKEGCKFFKVFGERSGTTGYADATFGTNYMGGNWGSIEEVSFGDGTTLVNDSQNVINLDGNHPKWIGRSYGTAVVRTPAMSDFSSADWGNTWHHFWIHVKFNSGSTQQNQVPNGEFYLKIDNTVYVDATGLYNRNPANEPIQFIGFFGWAQKDPAPFELEYYDIRISTGGFMSQTLPSPPLNVSVK